MPEGFDLIAFVGGLAFGLLVMSAFLFARALTRAMLIRDLENELAHLKDNLRPCGKHGQVAVGSIHRCVACADEEVEFQMQRADKAETLVNRMVDSAQQVLGAVRQARDEQRREED